MHLVANPAGRLVTFCVKAPATDALGEQAAGELRRYVVTIPGPVVVVTDLRDARAFSPATTERFVALMKADNLKIERSALLLGHDSPTLALQIGRMVKEAANPGRQSFVAADALAAWLEPVLSIDERAALRGFLAAAGAA